MIGDGGFMYACGELATVVEARIPLTIVLVDDGGYGMLRFDQVLAGEEPFGVDLVQPDFVALAGVVRGAGDHDRRLRAGVRATSCAGRSRATSPR